MNDRGGIALEVAGLAYHYPDGSSALRGIDLAIPAGQRMALLGPNGAGKSTLLLHLAGLLPERRRYLHAHGSREAGHRHDRPGRITIDGIELGPRTIRDVRDRVGIVFEDPDDQLFGLTVEEDVRYGPESRGWAGDDIDAAVREALHAVGLGHVADRSPHHLSAGEKRRACIAGAIVTRPGLLLLDEPSSGLDPRGRRELAALLDSLPATLVVASHDMELVRRLCARAVILDGGKLVADGPVSDLLADSERLERHGLA
ncbi:MAG: ABC transporter ATP-binding protein [Gemmatimonadota bacterium]